MKIKLYLIVLLFSISCDEDNIRDENNYDHCDLYTSYSEECADIKEECESNNGTYSTNSNSELTDWDDNDGCCCVY